MKMNAVPPTPRLSVLVLTRNRLDSLRRCVLSIMRQQCRDFEIVVLDDASDQCDTATSIAQEFADPRIRPYRAQSSLGVAGGRNFLMEKALGQHLVSIDDDAVLVGDDALGNVCHCFDREPGVGIIALKIVNDVQGQLTPVVPFRRTAVTSNPKCIFQRSYVPSFIGAGHAIRGSIIDAHGGYRDDLVFGGEEWDLAYRVIKAGYKILYEPSIEVVHFPMPSVVGGTKNGASSEVYYQIRNHAYLAYRYLPWKYAFPYMGAWMLRCAVRSFRDNSVLSFLHGTLSTPRFLRGVKREVLDRKALGYLAEHGGGRGTIY